MSNPIYSTDLYSPGNQDTLVLLKKQLEDIQILMDKLQTEAKQLKTSLAGAGTSPSKVVAAATEAQRINNAKQKLAVQQNLALDKMRRVSAAQTATAIVRSEQQQQREIEKTRQQMLRTQIIANRLAKSKIDLAKASNTTRSSFSGLLGSLRNLTYAYFSLSAAQQIVGKLFAETKQLNTLDAAFKQTLGSIQDVSAAKEFLIDITSRYGADLLTASNAYLKFGTAAKQAGVSAKDTNDIFESFTKASSVLGLGAERTSYVFLALEQIMSKGRLSTEELRRQLGEHLPGAFGIAAQAMKVTTAELTDMLKKGEIASTDFLPKFAKQIEIAYGIDSINKVDNLAAAQGRFNNEITLLIRQLDLAQGFKDFFNALTDGVKFISENIETIAKFTKSIVYLGTAWLAWKTTMAATRILMKFVMADTIAEITLTNLLAAAQLRAAAAQGKLNKVIAANPYGAALVAIIALVGVLDLLINKYNGVKAAKNDVNKAIADGSAAVEIERFQIDALVKSYGDEKTSLEEKERILKRLNELGVDVVDLNNDQKISQDELTAATDRYLVSLRNRVETEKLLADRANAINKIAELKSGIKGDNLFGEQGLLLLADKAFGSTYTNIGKQDAITQYEAYIKTIEDQIKSSGNDPFNLGAKNEQSTTPTNGDPEKDKFDAEKERIALILNNQARELAELQLAYERKRADFIANKEDTNALEEKYQYDRSQIINKYLDIEIQAYLDAEEEKRAAFKKATEDVVAYLDERRQAIADAEAKRQANVDFFRDEFSARREHEKAIFDLTTHTKEETLAFELKLKEDELNDELQLHRTFGKVLSDEEVKRVTELRDRTKAARVSGGIVGDLQDFFHKNNGDKGGNKDEETDIFSLLNINFDSPEAKQAVIDALDFAKSQLTDFLDFQKEIIDQEIENADRKVAAAENNLQRQIALQAANQANNVAGAQAELALAKKTQEDALKQRQKFQKTELALNTALEASNLGVAIAKTLAAGLGLAGIGLVALMLGAFAAAKIKAFQLVNKKTFRKGGFREIGGGSHESGNDTHVGGNNWAEKDESVGIFTAKATRKYKPSLKAIVNAANKGTLENILVQDRRAIQGINMTNRLDIDTSLMEKRLTRLVSLSETKTFVDGRGRLVKIDRGRTTIINR